MHLGEILSPLSNALVCMSWIIAAASGLETGKDAIRTQDPENRDAGFAPGASGVPHIALTWKRYGKMIHQVRGRPPDPARKESPHGRQERQEGQG